MMFMNRLKIYLLKSDSNVHYRDVYEGKLRVIPNGKKEEPYTQSEPIYWEDGIAYEFSRSNRTELSKPTVDIAIPVSRLKISEGLINGETALSRKGIPAADYCLRSFLPYIDELNERYTSRKKIARETGRFYAFQPDGKVLRRNGSYFKKVVPKWYYSLSGASGSEMKHAPEGQWCLILKIMIQLPERQSKRAIKMVAESLPRIVKKYIENFQVNEMKRAVMLYNKQEELRNWLRNSEYCAFIADGSILPREKDTDGPMKGAVPFTSVFANRVTAAGMNGMGIRRGVTVITGGGYSGKSTLLDAISEGIYNHVGGDGREYVITDQTAMKISAEDGRSVKNVNISPFIRWVPGGKKEHFSTEHASGSTSQAANIVEAVQYGSKLLLIDEDKSATNFMIRDEYMQELVKNEPIIPYTDRVQELSKKKKVSSLLVIGGSSEYLGVSDQILMMDQFKPRDVTKEARTLIAGKRKKQAAPEVDWNYKKTLLTRRFSTYPLDSATELMKVNDQRFLYFGDESIDTRMIHNITGEAQLTAIAFFIRKIGMGYRYSNMKVEYEVKKLMRQLEGEELDCIFSTFFPDCGRWLEMPREYEILAVINRMRNISFCDN